MQETVDSIMQCGVLNPTIIRPDPGGGYEMVAGHRRLHASGLAGKDTIPAIVRNLTDDEAVILLVDYPKFADAKQVSLPDDVSKTQPSFSGFIRYETEFDAVAQEQLQLEVTESWDSMEVFLNGRSLGIQVKPPFVYDLGELAPDGKNYLAIEVATTAARDVNARVKNWILKKVFPLVLHRTGITGDVTLYRRKQKFKTDARSSKIKSQRKLTVP